MQKSSSEDSSCWTRLTQYSRGGQRWDLKNREEFGNQSGDLWVSSILASFTEWFKQEYWQKFHVKSFLFDFNILPLSCIYQFLISHERLHTPGLSASPWWLTSMWPLVIYRKIGNFLLHLFCKKWEFFFPERLTFAWVFLSLLCLSVHLLLTVEDEVQHIEHHTARCKKIGRVGQYVLEGHVKGFFFFSIVV